MKKSTWGEGCHKGWGEGWSMEDRPSVVLNFSHPPDKFDVPCNKKVQWRNPLDFFWEKKSIGLPILGVQWFFQDKNRLLPFQDTNTKVMASRSRSSRFFIILPGYAFSLQPVVIFFPPLALAAWARDNGAPILPCRRSYVWYGTGACTYGTVEGIIHTTPTCTGCTNYTTYVNLYGYRMYLQLESTYSTTWYHLSLVLPYLPREHMYVLWDWFGQGFGGHISPLFDLRFFSNKCFSTRRMD